MVSRLEGQGGGTGHWVSDDSLEIVDDSPRLVQRSHLEQWVRLTEGSNMSHESERFMPPVTNTSSGIWHGHTSITSQPSGYMNPAESITNCLNNPEHRRELKKVLTRTLLTYQSSSEGKNYTRAQRAGEWVTHLRRHLAESNMYGIVSPSAVEYRRTPKHDAHFLIKELTDSDNWIDAGVLSRSRVPGREEGLLVQVVEKQMADIYNENDKLGTQENLTRANGHLTLMQHGVADMNQLLKEMRDLSASAERTLEKYDNNGDDG